MADFIDPDDLQTQRPAPGEVPMVSVRPKKEVGPRAEKNGGYDPSISKPMQEILDHIAGGESGGRYDVIYGGGKFDPAKGHPRIAVPIESGPNKGRTSSAAGRYQFLGSTWDAVAAKTGRHDMSPESQDINAAQLAKDTYKEQTGRDLEKDWASGDPELKKGIDRALGTQWESLAAGPRVSNLDIHGRPRLGFGFSDYAMKEHEGRPDTDIHWMSPGDYLDLVHPIEGKPFESPSGRSLLKSFQRGDHIESIPTLDVNVDGDTATVTDQDGRHRALLAQQEGVPAIPVAVRGIGDKQPKEIVGQRGDKRPLELPERGLRQEVPEQPKQPISLLQEVKDAIIPRAEAAEPTGENPYAKYVTPPPAAPAENPYAKYVAPETEEQRRFKEAHPERFPPTDASDEQQRQWMADQRYSDVLGGAARGAGPYAAGAGIGAGIGGAVGGPPGAAVGAGIGAGAVGLGELASGVGRLTGAYDAPAPHDATNALLDLAGVKQPTTFGGRMAEAVTGGAANALSGAGGLGLLATVLKNPASKVTANYLIKLAERGTKALSDNPALQTISGATSGGSAQLAAEAGLPPALQWLAGLAGGLAPGLINPVRNMGRINASPMAKRGIEAGFVLHPADAEATRSGTNSIADIAAAEAGKTKSHQVASMHNGTVSNLLAQEEIGLPRNTPLTPENFKVAEAPADAVYREVEKAVPEVDLARNPDFVNFVKVLGGRTAETERLFPEMAGTPEILQLRDQLLRNDRGATPSVMEKIADLRKQATENYQVEGDAAKHRLADAQRQAAQVMEEAMEDSVKNAPRYFQEKVNEARAVRAEATADFNYINTSGINDPAAQTQMGKQLEAARRRVEAANAATKKWEEQLAEAQKNVGYYQDLPEKFRQARQLFAKIYDLKSVTNKSTFDVSARGLARLLERGKPLTGNLRLIADMANSFPKEFQNPSVIGGVESMSVLDAAFAGAEAAKAVGKLAAGHPGGLANLAVAIGALARRAVRGKMMSPGAQNAMIQPKLDTPMPWLGMTSSVLPTQPVPGNPGGNALMGLTTQQ